MTVNDRPKEDFDKIVAEFQQMDISNMSIEEITTECIKGCNRVKGCNPHDVMIGFKLATLMYTTIFAMEDNL